MDMSEKNHHNPRIRIKEQGLPADAESLLPIGSAAALLVIGVVALIITLMNWSL